MAGIGFELKVLSKDRSPSVSLANSLFGTVVVAAPWVLTIGAMGVLQRVSQQGAGDFALQSIVIYIFFVTLVATAPVIALCGRKMADDLYRNDPTRLSLILGANLLFSWLSTLLLAFLVFNFLSSMVPADVAVCALASGLVGLTWPALAFASALKRYSLVFFAFVMAVAVSVAMAFVLHEAGYSAPIQAFGFSSGLAIGASIVVTSLVAKLGHGSTGGVSLANDLAKILDTHRPVVLGALLAVAAIWIDSVVVWFGPLGQASANGLATSPAYDSAMFVARLAMIPGLVFHVLSLDASVHRAIRRYLDGIEARDSLMAIEARLDSIQTVVDRQLRGLLVLQVGVTAILVLVVPFAVSFVGLAHVQIATLQFGVMGALFHVVFIAVTAMVLNCGAERAFCWLQAFFLMVNAVSAAASVQLSADILGAGYLVATLVSALVAVLVLQSALQNLTPSTFEASFLLAMRDAGPAVRTMQAFGTLPRRIRKFMLRYLQGDTV
ncbi:MAG: exopolysaccharide Pel transporter PelG [Pseudomonadota bacterium]|nr:exopolysaccharide Pel transporter PelG [Pseudomonadota bacterium]